MTEMHIEVERVTDEAQVGTTCRCGECHPTATVYRDDPTYRWHEVRLAEGPCCCGRFFAVGHTPATALERAQAMAAERRQQGMAPNGYEFETQQVELPWDATVTAVIADLCD